MPNALCLPLKPKHQRFDSDRDGAGRFEDVAEIDEVEVVQRDAVDGEDVVFYVEIMSENIAHQTRQIVVEDKINGTATFQCMRQASDQALAECCDAASRRRSSPAKHQSNFRFALF